jgi:hypothetical protein
MKLLDKKAGAEYSLRKAEKSLFRGLFGRFFILMPSPFRELKIQIFRERF